MRVWDPQQFASIDIFKDFRNLLQSRFQFVPKPQSELWMLWCISVNSAIFLTGMMEVVERSDEPFEGIRVLTVSTRKARKLTNRTKSTYMHIAMREAVVMEAHSAQGGLQQ